MLQIVPTYKLVPLGTSQSYQVRLSSTSTVQLYINVPGRSR